MKNHYYNHWLALAEAGSGSDHQDHLAAALERCAGQLPASSAQLIELRYQRALNFGEIAARIGRTVEATRQQLARIRLALRDCIEKRLTQS